MFLHGFYSNTRSKKYCLSHFNQGNTSLQLKMKSQKQSYEIFSYSARFSPDSISSVKSRINKVSKTVLFLTDAIVSIHIFLCFYLCIVICFIERLFQLKDHSGGTWTHNSWSRKKGRYKLRTTQKLNNNFFP